MSVDVGEGSGRARLGFLGLGWIGRKRLDAIASVPSSYTGVEIAALFDTEAEALAAAAQAYPNAHRAVSFDELLSLGLDGIVIATPNGAHAPQALRALSRGTAVFCQKPLATTAAATHQVIQAARAADRLLGVDFSYRHVAGMGELKARIAAGALGAITGIDLTFHNAYGPGKQWCFDRTAAGGGCLLDLGVHLIDLALWLQSYPRLDLVSARRFAQGRPCGHEVIEDQAYAELRADSGTMVRIGCSWYAHIGCDAHIEARVLGTKAGAVWRNVDGSFYDFELFVGRGAQRERLARPPDAWGARGLTIWAQRLAQDPSFDPTALEIARSADLIEEIYAR